MLRTPSNLVASLPVLLTSPSPPLALLFSSSSACVTKPSGVHCRRLSLAGPPAPVQESMDANLQKLTQLVNKESNLIEKVLLLLLFLTPFAFIHTQLSGAHAALAFATLHELKSLFFLSCRWMTTFAVALSISPTEQRPKPVWPVTRTPLLRNHGWSISPTSSLMSEGATVGCKKRRKKSSKYDRNILLQQNVANDNFNSKKRQIKRPNERTTM